jgi:hypothetical protein
VQVGLQIWGNYRVYPLQVSILSTKQETGWTSGRNRELHQWCKKNGKNWKWSLGTVQTQLTTEIQEDCQAVEIPKGFTVL